MIEGQGNRRDHPADGVGFSSCGKSNIGFHGAGFGCMARPPVKLRGVFSLSLVWSAWRGSAYNRRTCL